MAPKKRRSRIKRECVRASLTVGDFTYEIVPCRGLLRSKDSLVQVVIDHDEQRLYVSEHAEPVALGKAVCVVIDTQTAATIRRRYKAKAA